MVDDFDWTNPYQSPVLAKIAARQIQTKPPRIDRLPAPGPALPAEHWDNTTVEDAGTTGYVDVVEAKTETGTTVYFVRSCLNRMIASGTDKCGYTTARAAAAAAFRAGHVARNGVRQHPYTLDATFDERNTP